MAGKTFAEKILGGKAGTRVMVKPDIVLSHDNSVKISETFKKLGGENIADPDQLVIVLDHNSVDGKDATGNEYRFIRDMVKAQNISKFHDMGQGICHQMVALYAQPGMIIVGSDRHTCTSGAFNSYATAIDTDETATLWKSGTIAMDVPESMRIQLNGKLKPHIYSKDLALWISGKLGTGGAKGMSVEFHGEGIQYLSMSDRMTIANMAVESGAISAVFPADEILFDFTEEKNKPIWADEDAQYSKKLEIQLGSIFPLVAIPHETNNIKAVSEVEGIMINQAIIGTCSNGRIEDLRAAADVLNGRRISNEVQLMVVPASQMIYLLAMEEGIIQRLIKSGATIMPPSCGTCLGKGTTTPADNYNIISTANRNSKGRLGNVNSSIYLASPATVAKSALEGFISDPREYKAKDKF
jgi:3-isopropylmalate/(R)-2-methylmalate dehydratase large subunit